MGSFFTLSCVLFGCTHSSPSSLVTRQGAGTALRLAFAGSLECIRDLRTQYPTIKIKYCASNDLLMEQSHASQSAWASQIASLPSTSLDFAHTFPVPTSPSLGYGAFGGLHVREMCVCVCVRAKMQVLQKTWCLSSISIAASWKREQQQIFVDFHIANGSHLRAALTVQGS